MAENFVRLILNNHLFEALEILENIRPETKEEIKTHSQRICDHILLDVKEFVQKQEALLKEQKRGLTSKDVILEKEFCSDWLERLERLISKGLLVDRKGVEMSILDITIQHLSLEKESERILGRHILDKFGRTTILSGLDVRFTRLNARKKDRIFQEVWMKLHL